VLDIVIDPLTQPLCPSPRTILEDARFTRFLSALSAHPHPTHVIAELANRFDIQEVALKRARRELPSFSHHITWAEVAAFFPPLRAVYRFTTFDPIPQIPSCFLPPSFHEELFVRSWAAMDVYSEPTENILEAPKVRLLEIVRLVSIFSIP
jgi:hypothetical protein